MMDRESQLPCLRCGRQVSPTDKSVALYLFAQTVAMRPRRKSPATKIVFCPRCAVSAALGPEPDVALDRAAYGVLQKLVATDPAVAEVAWQKLNSGLVVILPPALTEGTTMELPRHAVSGPSLREAV